MGYRPNRHLSLSNDEIIAGWVQDLVDLDAVQLSCFYFFLVETPATLAEPEVIDDGLDWKPVTTAVFLPAAG